MRVQIIGAGAVGLLVASYLRQSGLSVLLVVRNEQQRQQLEQNGLTRIEVDGSLLTQQIVVSHEPVHDVDLTIVTTKSYQLHSLLKQLSELPSDVALLFMQNGLAHYELALKLPQRHIGFASVQFGATRDNETTVVHKGIGVFKLAIAKGSVEHFHKVVQCTNERFPIVVEQDAYAMLFEKAILNCFVNPMTAILQVKNGALLENKAAFLLLQQLYRELKDTFSMEMENLPFELIVSLCEKTAANTSSMLMDRLCERQSEVDAIVLPIIERAEQLGRQVPTLRTLYRLVVALEVERER